MYKPVINTYIYYHTLHNVIFAMCFFALLYVEMVLHWHLFSQSQLVFKIDNMRYMNSSSLKLETDDKIEKVNKIKRGKYFPAHRNYGKH